MKTMHLFAGAGGGLLADLILGHDPVVAVEWDAYCCRVLRERAAEGWFPNLSVWEGDVRLFDPSPWAGRVDCVHAGFPCPSYSVAGKRLGMEDDRGQLWYEVVRVLRVVRPQYAFLENVGGLLTSQGGYAITRIMSDLAEIGYDTRWTRLRASDVGASHPRMRWWALANAQNPYGRGTKEANDSGWRVQKTRGPMRCFGPPGPGKVGLIPRMDDAVAGRVDRLKALGNGQVPLQAAAAWKLLGGP